MATGLDANIPEIWTKDFLLRYHNNCVMRNLCNTKYEGVLKNGGDTVHVHVPGAITLNSYTRESAVTYQTLTTTKESMTISDSRDWAFRIDALDVAQLTVDMLQVERDEAALTYRDAVDTSILAHYANTDASNVVGSTGSPISLTKDNVFDYFAGMGTLLSVANARGMKRSAVVPPAVAEMIVKSPELRNRSTGMVDTNIQNGLMIKNFAGFELYVTTNMAAVSGAYPLMFFTEHFIHFVEQVNTIEVIPSLQNYHGPGVKGLALFDSKVFTQTDGEGAVLYAAAS